MHNTHLKNEGIYTSLQALIRLQHQAAGFSFLPKQPVHSLLAGRHASRLRGRGLDFEELRRYLPGDDVRTIDWKVTNRTRQAHVRVYSEERERPVLAVVDQRLSMFFGTQVNMKSVTAAEAAALACWRTVGQGDRVGALVFNDSEVREFRAQRSRKTVMQILHAIVAQNQALGIDRGIKSNPAMLNQVLQRVSHLAKHDTLVAVISDFHGRDEQTLSVVKRLSRNNDVILLLIHDPILRQLPKQGRIVISDGIRQLEIDPASAKMKQRYPEAWQGRIGPLTEELSKFGVPLLPIHTAQDVASQVRETLGYVPGKGMVRAKRTVRGAR
ncbi:DUF58 domain-containing protein [Planctomycetota bacterium]